MLSLDESQRPQSIQEVKQELDQLSAPAPSQSLPPSSTTAVRPTILPTKPASSHPRPSVPKPTPVADPYATPVADPYASASHLNQILAPPITPPPPPVKRTSVIRIIFAILGLILGSLSSLIGISGANLQNIAQQSSYTMYQNLSLGSLFFFFGLLIILLSIIRKKGLPLSNLNKTISVLGLLIGIIACLSNFILIIGSYTHSFFDDLTYSSISLIISIIIIIGTRPRK